MKCERISASRVEDDNFLGVVMGNGQVYVKCRLSAILEVDVSSRLGLGARLRRIANGGYAGQPHQGHQRG